MGLLFSAYLPLFQLLLTPTLPLAPKLALLFWLAGLVPSWSHRTQSVLQTPCSNPGFSLSLFLQGLSWLWPGTTPVAFLPQIIPQMSPNFLYGCSQDPSMIFQSQWQHLLFTKTMGQALVSRRKGWFYVWTVDFSLIFFFFIISFLKVFSVKAPTGNTRQCIA